MIRTTIIAIIFNSFIIFAFSQSKTDIGLAVIPSLSTIHSDDKSLGYKYIIPINYGLRANYKMNRFSFSTGMLFMTQGTKFEVEITTQELPEGWGEYFDVFYRIKSITIPLNFDYSFIQTNKTEIFSGIGIYCGYIYSQQQENTSIPKNYEPDPNIIPALKIQRFTDINLFDKNYFGINIDIGIRKLINKNLSFELRPNFLFQLRSELASDKYYYTPRLMSFSLDIGLFYNINKAVDR